MAKPGSVHGPCAEFWIVPRSPQSLLELPVAVRWEVTRRHPYYLRFWDQARRFRQSPSADPTLRVQEESASFILHAIGVTGEPSPPSASAEDIGASILSPGWQSGAIAPLSFRALAAVLLLELPGETRAALGQFLVDSAPTDTQSVAQRYPLLQRLESLRTAGLDQLSVRPLVGVNLAAPQRMIGEALETLVRQWKHEQAIAETRRRDDKLTEYLNAWDRREGWTGDRYEGSQEQTLRQMAQSAGLPVSTMANHYRSGFRLIVGQDYSPELWARLIGFLKLTEWFDPGAVPRRSLHRPSRKRQKREVPETVLGSAAASERGGLLNTIGISPDEIKFTELVLDLQELIAVGKSNEAIVRELELCGPAALEMIENYRERHVDRL